jgi:hypothetical protein
MTNLEAWVAFNCSMSRLLTKLPNVAAKYMLNSSYCVRFDFDGSLYYHLLPHSEVLQY